MVQRCFTSRLRNETFIMKDRRQNRGIKPWRLQASYRIYFKSPDKVGDAGQGAFNKKQSFSSATGVSSLNEELDSFLEHSCSLIL